MQSTFRVSICGGGIGGLMLAVVIGKYGDLPVEVFEAGSEMTTVGAGIALFGRTMDIMKEMGLYDEFVQMATAPPEDGLGPTFRKSDQRDGYQWFSKDLKHGLVTFHRKDIVDFLLRHIPVSCKIHTSKKLRSYEVDSETGKTTLHFADGSSSVTDVLVGADGIHSATRRTMYQALAASTRDEDYRKRLLECVDPAWTGIIAYRSLIPTVKLLKEYPDLDLPTGLTLNLGKNKSIVVYPVSQGRLINVVIFRHEIDAFGMPFEGQWVTDVSEAEISDQFEDWEIQSQAIVKCIEKPSRWALHSLRPLPRYADRRAALLGDAAHAMESHLGAGAGQAMEDAYVLGRLLTHESTHLGNVADALRVYDDVRLSFANSIVRRSREVGRLYTLQPTSGSVQGRPEELESIRKRIEDVWGSQNEGGWVWGDAEARWHAKWGTRTKL